MPLEEVLGDLGAFLHAHQHLAKVAQKWQDVFWKSTPVLEIIAGLTDGSITGLVIILSALLGRINLDIALFSSLLTLTAVMITNFSSFFLGGTTEDYSDLATFQELMQYSLGDAPDKAQRDKSLNLLNNLASIFRTEIRKNNLVSTIACGVTTFGAGIIPVMLFYYVIEPWDVILSIGFVLAILFAFLVYYRARRGKSRLKITLLENVIIIGIAVVASLILCQTA